jgi:GNAT superfamily N-acetyltransferase
MTLRITVAERDDIPALCELLNILFSQEAEFTPDAEAQRRGLARIIANPEIGTILIACDDRRIVGMVNLLYTVSTALGASVALLEDMVVLPDARGGGIGTRLLQEAIALARTRNCKRITLLTDQDNELAQGFYQGHGFTSSTMIPLRFLLDEQEK